MAGMRGPRELHAVDPLRVEEAGTSPSDQAASARDREADERDREADARDREADERDREADTAERQVPDGIIDLRDRRALTQLRHQAAAERQQAALDRAAAAVNRIHASADRKVAEHERGDANEEREILQRDELTGVLQRGAGLIALEREVARSARSGDTFVVAFIDVDGLKRINDELGHGSGDEVLRTLGETLRTGMRSYDLALRYGGDEFVCILPGFGVVEAEARFGAIQAKLAQGPVPVSVTFGIAEWRPGEDTDALLARADAALYEVRRALRGGDGSGDDPRDDDATSAVAAHRLLNSSAVVSMAATTLLARWDDMPAPDSIHLLERVHRHDSTVVDHLRGVTRGHLGGERLTSG